MKDEHIGWTFDNAARLFLKVNWSYRTFVSNNNIGCFVLY